PARAGAEVDPADPLVHRGIPVRSDALGLLAGIRPAAHPVRLARMSLAAQPAARWRHAAARLPPRTALVARDRRGRVGGPVHRRLARVLRQRDLVLLDGGAPGGVALLRDAGARGSTPARRNRRL